MIDAAPAGIIMHDTVPFVGQLLPSPIGRRCDGAPPLRAAERLHAEVIDRHRRTVGQH